MDSPPLNFGLVPSLGHDGSQNGDYFSVFSKHLWNEQNRGRQQELENGSRSGRTAQIFHCRRWAHGKKACHVQTAGCPKETLAAKGLPEIL
jgi:hypothetical protein